MVLRYPYVVIQELRIPKDWTKKKDTFKNPFQVGDILVWRRVWKGIYEAFQVVRVTQKMVITKRIQVKEDRPCKDLFITDIEERKGVRKDRSGEFVVNHGDYVLYKYNEE